MTERNPDAATHAKPATCSSAVAPSSTAPAAGRAPPTSGSATGASPRSAVGLRPDGERELDASGARRHARLHRRCTPTSTRRCSGTRRATRTRSTASPPRWSATARCRCSRSIDEQRVRDRRHVRVRRGRPDPTRSPTTCRGRGHDYAGYRDAIDAQGVGLNIAALMGHSPLRLVVMGDDAWERPRHDRASARGWRPSSTPRWRTARGDSRRRSSTRTAPGARCRRATPTTPSSTRCSTCSATAAAGSSSSSPTSPGPSPEVGMDRLASAAARAASRSRRRASSTATRCPERTEHWLERHPPLPRAGRAVLAPALAPHRRLPRQLGQPHDVHGVPGRGLAPGDPGAAGRRQGARCSRDPQWRATAREPSGTRSSRSMFPHRRIEQRPHRRGDATPTTSSGSAVRSPTSSPSAAVTRPTCSPTSCSPTTAGPGIVAVGVANADVDERGPHAARRQRARQLVRRGRPRADAVRVGRHDPVPHPPRPRARRLHARAGDPRAHRPAGRRVRVPRPRRARAAGRAADLAVFALDELHWDDDVFVARPPGRVTSRLRRPEGGYRATVVNGVARAGPTASSPARCRAGCSTSTPDKIDPT